ncbi:diguanylate cyclase [Halomonas qinghailakensis]|uniref:diguanylate cyclase n=2 Tax=Halomonas TaxID=2745 RepID=A0AA46TSD1_9GAMM|nr:MULTISPECIES: sensor domain-containing diguanylate cyclase [Halomonas]UYO75678.1 diguanylate cyclase [Halomonas sp. ZZQ-149]UYV19429.1 diguanylate cyclase [Halomonas qaidamensis]
MKKPTEEAVLWSALFEQSGDGMVVLRQNGSVYRVNQCYADMLGYTVEAMKELYVWDWDTQFSQCELQQMLLTVDNSGEHFNTQQRRKDGAIIDVELSNNSVLYQGENLIFCIARDITKRKLTEERLRHKEELLQSIASQVPGALYQYRMTPEGTRSFPYFSEGAVELGGLSLEELYRSGAAPIMSRILPEDAAMVEANIQKTAKQLAHAQSEFRILHGDGSIRWIESRSAAKKEVDGSILWTGILLDITQRKLAEERVRTMAITDGLTGITNRQEISRLLAYEVERTARYDTPFSLIMYDLDHFKQVNDQFGHNAGDEVLKTVTKLVNDTIRGIDLHGRWGGEEFMIILPQTQLEAAKNIAEKLRQAVAAYHFEKIGTVTASFGVAERAPQENSQLIAQRVDEALYRAKMRGRNRVET